MAEPKKALETPPTQVQISINYSQGSWSPTPQSSTVQPNGTVQFIPNQTSWVWTMVNNALATVFQGQTNDYVQVVPGQTNEFTVDVSNNTTITIIPLGQNSNPPTPDITENVRGTVKVSSTGLDDKSEKK